MSAVMRQPMSIRARIEQIESTVVGPGAERNRLLSELADLYAQLPPPVRREKTAEERAIQALNVRIHVIKSALTEGRTIRLQSGRPMDIELVALVEEREVLRAKKTIVRNEVKNGNDC